MKTKIRKMLFWTGVILSLWPLIILTGGVMTRNYDVSNTLSLGIFYKLMLPGFQQLSVIFFFTVALIGFLLKYFFSDNRK